jgi:hypothetical protein
MVKDKATSETAGPICLQPKFFREGKAAESEASEDRVWQYLTLYL